MARDGQAQVVCLLWWPWPCLRGSVGICDLNLALVGLVLDVRAAVGIESKVAGGGWRDGGRGAATAAAGRPTAGNAQRSRRASCRTRARIAAIADIAIAAIATAVYTHSADVNPRRLAHAELVALGSEIVVALTQTVVPLVRNLSRAEGALHVFGYGLEHGLPSVLVVFEQWLDACSHSSLAC